MAEQLGEFKGQPWIVFDTVAARSFLVGENRPTLFAFGTSGPAITAAGEMVFFSSGRTQANMPWYTNVDLVGQLSYGFEVWQMYFHIGFPQVPSAETDQPIEGSAFEPAYPLLLAAAIIDFGVLELNLGQEIQTQWPLHRFGSGGGYASNGGGALQVVQNAIPQGSNVLALPEPIEVPRTQNLDAKIRLAPEILSTIGSPTAFGVGMPLYSPVDGINGGWLFQCPNLKQPVNLPFPPYTVQLGLIGRRVKKTQYGQTPQAQPGA